jgi:hypothetical protein
MQDQLTVLARMREAFQNRDVTVHANSTTRRAMGYLLEPLVATYFQMGWEVLETTSISFVMSDCPVHRYYLPGQYVQTGLFPRSMQVIS